MQVLNASNVGRQPVLIVDKNKHAESETSIVSVRLNACPVYMDERSS